jgi:hypothetical protein
MAGRNTLKGPVVYCTGEGINGFRRRLIAMRQHYEVEGQKIPFFHIERVPDLGSEATDVNDLIADINRHLNERGLPPPRVVALDTLARCMVGGDENSARDMSRFIGRCDQIERAFGCLVAVVHHTGKDESRGARGSNALLGALDCEWTVERNGDVRSARVSRMKDGQDDVGWQFALKIVTAEPQTSVNDDYGCALTTCVVEVVSDAGEAQTTARRKKKPAIKGLKGDLLNIIRDVIPEAGETEGLPREVPPNKPAIRRAVLKNICLKKAWLTEPHTNREQNSGRAKLAAYLSRLRAEGVLNFDREWVWLT